MPRVTEHVITPHTAGTLAGLLRERIRHTPDAEAYRRFDPASGKWVSRNWRETGEQAARWQAALKASGLNRGDRVAVMLRNCPEWVLFDQAAQGLGLVVVPLYTDDRPDNVAYILANCGARLLLIAGDEHWRALSEVRDQLGFLSRIVTLERIASPHDGRLVCVDDWLPDDAEGFHVEDIDPGTLATIVYTSGTTGRPKGVMLSHHNILWNAHAAQKAVAVYPDDLFLSFLPLSHTFERTVGYYLPMMCGAAVAYNRSIPELAEDLLAVRPTVLISVPRIFERVYNKIQAGLEEKSPFARRLFERAVELGWNRFEVAQGRGTPIAGQWQWPLLERLVARKVMQKLGGRMRVAVAGGAALPPTVARLFIGLGLPLIQGYGLTETSPVIAANRLEDNVPESVGRALDGVEVRIGEGQELLTRSPSVMLGYWDNPEATAQMIDDEGWLHTGDQARIDDKGHIFITGRLKEIIVLANGEKVPPADMEMAISLDPLFDQAMVIGDGRPYLAALVVLNPEQWRREAARLGLDPDQPESLHHPDWCQQVLGRIAERLREFPGYAQVRAVSCQLDPWTIEDGLITPTLKLRRNRMTERFADEIQRLYEGH